MILLGSFDWVTSVFDHFVQRFMEQSTCFYSSCMYDSKYSTIRLKFSRGESGNN